jgi:hypothetical protein
LGRCAIFNPATAVFRIINLPLRYQTNGQVGH